MKTFIISLVLLIALFGAAVYMNKSGGSGGTRDDSSGVDTSFIDQQPGRNEPIKINPPTVVDGKQIIEIGAKGGYYPNTTEAKADLPTILRVKTAGTFDCSSSLAIPALNVSEYLPNNGVKEIEIPAQKAGSVIRGMCSMGMYGFEINFN